MSTSLEAALPGRDDRAEYDALLRRIHEDTFAGRVPPAHPRAVIAESWQRLRRRGVRPDRRAIDPVPQQGSAADRATMLSFLPLVRRHLSFLMNDDALLLVIADADARVLHTESAEDLLERAGDLGFAAGAVWSEENVGTNAVGTALSVRRPVHVHGAEPYQYNQHGWSCACAPVRDPRSGATIGAFNVSVGSRDADANILGLVSLLAHTAQLELRERHRRDLDRLRTASRFTTHSLPGPWAVVDPWGWPVDGHGLASGRRMMLPEGLHDGLRWSTAHGELTARRLPDGWLLLGDAAGDRIDAAHLAVHRTASGADVTLRTASSTFAFEVTPRQTDLLELLAAHPAGLTATQLSAAIYGTPEHDVTVRAEISRLRRRLGDALVAAPYRFAPDLLVEVLPEA